ncbi:MAG: glycosyltransferase [Phycisphaerales bacterium]|nr:glycosyltransferase [Phycisphaerales bacterium]
MRILHISTRLILGGSQENTVLSCEHQARRGHDVHLAFGPIYGPEGSLLSRVESFQAADGKRITTHVLPHLRREVHPWHDHFCFHHDLKRLIRTVQPDIVHTHSSKAGILGRWAAWLESAKRDAGHPLGVVHTIHGPPFMPIEGGPLTRLKVRLNNTIYTHAERFAAKRCHVIASVADAMTTQFRARGIGRPDQFVTVRSGMEIGPFLHPAHGQSRDEVRAALGIKPADFILGTVARLAQHKGHDDILDALARDFASRPNLKLLWVGDGWWRDRLVSRARQMGLDESRLILPGLVSPDRIPGLMRAMDALSHPSYREGLPRTVPQALLSGVCPIAYDCDGTGEICKDMHTGRLVPTGNRAALRSAILWAMDNPAERARLASTGREMCTATFSAEHMADELAAAYERAQSEARAQARAR